MTGLDGPGGPVVLVTCGKKTQDLAGQARDGKIGLICNRCVWPSWRPDCVRILDERAVCGTSFLGTGFEPQGARHLPERGIG